MNAAGKIFEGVFYCYMNDATDSEQGRILVVDDEPSVRLSFRLALETEGWLVDDVGGADQAMKIMASIAEQKQGRPLLDGLVLDYRMPGKTGSDLVAEMNRSDWFVPTVMTSAHLDDETVIEAVGLGVANFLRKPVSLPGLREGVEQMVREDQAFSREVDPSEANSMALHCEQKNLIRIRGLVRRRQWSQVKSYLARILEAPSMDPKDLPQGLSAWSTIVQLSDNEGPDALAALGEGSLFDLLAAVG